MKAKKNILKHTITEKTVRFIHFKLMIKCTHVVRCLFKFNMERPEYLRWSLTGSQSQLHFVWPLCIFGLNMEIHERKVCFDIFYSVIIRPGTNSTYHISIRLSVRSRIDFSYWMTKYIVMKFWSEQELITLNNGLLTNNLNCFGLIFIKFEWKFQKQISLV